MNQNKGHDENWALAKAIGDQLGEKERGPRMQIASILRYCGEEFTQKLLQDALETEEQGGLMLPDKSRRRTLGGVFFFLARERMGPEMRRQIFYPRGQTKKNKHTKADGSTPTEPRRPSLAWNERRAIIEGLLAEKGEVRTVKVTLIGRPGKIEQRQDLVITTMSHASKGGTFPKGVPTPPSTPTLYTVYIAMKQWRRIEAAITNPEDFLIIEGTCAYDQELKAIAVFATNVTTKMTDIKRREGQKASSTVDNKAEDAPPKKQPAAPKPQTASIKSAAADPPTGMPTGEAQKLNGLYASAALFRQKIAAIQAKPADQQSGLEMTQKLLKGVEDQIAALENKYT